MPANLRENAFGLLPFSEAMGQARGETGLQDFALGGADIVVETTDFDGSFVEVVDNVAGFGVAVAGLADAADIDEIFLARFGLELGVSAAADHGVAHEGDGHMGMAEEADAGVLVSEAGGSSEFIEDVAPALGPIERGMDDGKAGDEANVPEVAEPFEVVLGELVAGPVDGFLGVGVKTFEIGGGGAVFVVIAFDAGHAHGTNDIEAFLGVGSVTDDIAEAGVVGAIHGLGIGQHRVERLKIGVNICYNRVPH